MREERSLGVVRGAALYVGALIGPGVLLVPALAAQAAGPASIVAWAALLVLSAPLAITFAALGVRHPVAGGVAAYVRAGLGDAAAAVTGMWFMTAILIGGPAVSLIGGYYVADLTGSGTRVAVVVGLLMFGVVLAANAFGLRVSSGFQLVLSAVLVVVIASAVGIALPSRAGDNWTPFAPHGWLAVGDAASILMWLFIGWEAMAQLAGEFRRPEHDLPRAMALAFGVVTALYVGLAVATIAVTVAGGSRVPLADLVAVGFGRAGRDATAVLAVALTMGTMNVYMGGAAKLAAALAQEGALPRRLAGATTRSIPRRPLLVLALVGTVVLLALGAGFSSAADLVRATSACFVAVYLLSLASAVRILEGGMRVAAIVSLALVAAVAVFSSAFLLVPAAAAVVVLVLRLGTPPRKRLACETPRSDIF
ncbi:MAG: amino acid permease [Gaiellaceae bacterium]|jgi:amino acid efflux transporter